MMPINEDFEHYWRNFVAHSRNKWADKQEAIKKARKAALQDKSRAELEAIGQKALQQIDSLGKVIAGEAENYARVQKYVDRASEQPIPGLSSRVRRESA